MLRFSLKVKILLTIVTLTLMSLGVFGFLTFNSYKKDKLAFVYDGLASETQSKSLFFTSTVTHYDFFLGSIISRMDANTKLLPEGTKNFFDGQKNFLGLYFHIPDNEAFAQTVLYEGPEWSKKWSELEKSPVGLSLLDSKKGYFLYKKSLSIDGGFAGVAFKNMDLLNIMKSGGGRYNFLVKGSRFMSKEDVSIDLKSQGNLLDILARNQAPFGLFEAQVEGEKFFVSFARMPYRGMSFVSLIKEAKVLLIQNVFLKQVLIFLVLMGSIALLVGTICSSWLTMRLDDLTVAAQQFENEQFDYVVEVDSNDEIGTVGHAFNSMGEKIQNLLEELRKYTSQLEVMVADRTRELQKLTNIQNAMLNSLGQGFVIVNKEHKILPVYSKVAVEMFEKVPNESEPGDILGLKPEDASPFKELYDLVFSNALDFDDMAKMNPDFRSNSKEQKIQLTYAPIRNESGDLDYVLIIGTDKTTELETMEKFKKEWNFSQMITKIVSNRYSLIKIIKESLSMIRASVDVLESGKEFAIKDVQRYVHTVKGSFSYFNIEETTQLAHELESFLEPHYKNPICGPELKLSVLEKLMGLQISIECYVDHYDNIIQYKSANFSKNIPIVALDRFDKLLMRKSSELHAMFRNEFYRIEIQPFFQMYPSIIQDLGTKLNKKVKFTMEGAHISLPEGPWDEVFGQFIHFVRNSVDHGIESEADRQAAGKDQTGEIRFSFELKADGLKITLADDGRGIDWTKIAAKDPTVKNEQDAIMRIMVGGISSKDEVSDVSGRGVGVSAIFSSVERLGGKIEVFNRVGKGLKLQIVVPFVKDETKKAVA